MVDYSAELDEVFGTAEPGPQAPAPKLTPWQRSASVVGADDIDADPDQAARALQLSKATGTPASVVHADLDDFELQHKTQLTSEIIQSSPHIQDYINNYPMASKVSNDDYHNLDNLGWLSTRVVKTVGDKFFEGLKEGWGEEPLGGNEETMNKTAAYFGMDRGEFDKLIKVVGTTDAWKASLLVAYGVEALFRLPRAAIHGLGKGGAAFLHANFGMDEYQSERTIGSLLEWGVNRGDIGTIAPKITVQQASRIVGKARVYIDAGEVPPPGVDMFLDAAKYIAATENLKNLREAQKAARESKTIKRSPDAGEEFLRGPTEGRTLGISADAVMELYKDKPPEPGDGLLGWVPGIAQQLRVAAQTGGDIQVPLAGWLAHMDPAVAKQLEEHVRGHTHGVTVFEAEAMKEREKLTEPLAQAEEPPEGAKNVEDFLVKGAAPKAANLNISQAEIIAKLPGPVPFMERIWKNYAKHMSPEEFLQSEPLWSGAQRLADSIGISESEAFAYIANDMWSRMGANRYITPELAKSYIRMEGAKSKGIGIVEPREPITVEDLARKEAALDEPLAMVGKSDLRLKRVNPDGEFDVFHLYSGGKKVGDMTVALTEKRVLYIENIQTGQGHGSNAFGLHAVKALLDELKREYPKAVAIGGYRVTGAREKATAATGQDKMGWTQVSLKDKPEALAQFFDEMGAVPKGWESVDGGLVREPSPPGTLAGKVGNVDVEWRPTELLSAKEHETLAAIDSILKQIAPGLKWHAVDRLEVQGAGMERAGPVGGVYAGANRIGDALLLATLREKGTIGTVLHEVIHHLRSGFFTKDEWTVLEKAARDGKWADKHGITSRYPKAPEWLRLEEAIAEEFRYWADENLLASKLPKEAASAFQKVKELFAKIMQAIRDVYGKEVTFDELFVKVSAGEIGAREPVGIGAGRFKEIKAEAPNFAQVFAQATEVEEAQMFARGAAIGMTEANFKKYMKLIEQNKEEIEARAQARAAKAQAVTKTEQWKENEPRVKDEVTVQVNQRPDIMADEYFRRGYFNGEITKRSKLGSEFLTDEQKAALGPSMVSDKGLNPTSVAGLFGYLSGEDLVRGLAALQEARTQLKMTPAAYKTKLIREQTEVQMMKKYGVPEHDRLLREAREDIISETAMDMLHQETMALGLKSGGAPTITKEKMKEWVYSEFEKSNTKNAKDMEGFLRNAGRAGREAETALLKGDFTEAFRQKQRQFISTLFAAEAKKFDKEMDRLDRTAKRLAPREVKNVEHEYIDYAQLMLRHAGYTGRRDFAELRSVIADKPYKDFDAFVQAKQADKWEISAPQWILDWAIPKLEDMNVTQVREFKEVIDQLVYTARQEKIVYINGEAREWADVKAILRKNIQSLPVQPPDAPKTILGKVKAALWRIDATLAKPEEMLKDLDLRQEVGPLWGATFHGIVNSKHTEMGLQERLTKEWNTEIKALGRKWRNTLSDTIPNNFFVDPYYGGGQLFELTRSDLIGIMLYWGNRSNIKKFTEGYAGKDGAAALEVQLKSLMDRYAKKEDWDFVKKAWSTFEPLRQDANAMYNRVSGVPPKWIQPDPFDTPHGQMPGGYYPIFWDPARSRAEARLRGSYFDENFQSSTVSNHYTIERTNYVDRINFRGAVDLVSSRYQQMIHDISYREAIKNTQKVMKDDDIRADISKHYGKEYLNNLDSTFKNLANQFNLHERELGVWQDWLRTARFNVVTHALGFNLRVILSPSTGRFGLRELPQLAGQVASTIPIVRDIANWSENYKMSLEKSRELSHTFRNMDRDFREKLDQVTKNNAWSQFQAKAFNWAFAPVVYVEQQFRTLTFVREYREAKAAGLSEGEAVSRADAQVRQYHGAGGVADLAPLMQSRNEWVKLSTLFYGWFNTMYNLARPIPGHIRRAEYTEALARGWWSVLVPAAIGAVLYNSAKEDDSIFKIGAKAIALQLTGTLPLGREFANLFVEGHPTRSPLTSIFQSMKSVWGDITTNSPIKRKTVQHGANAVGLVGGLPLGQVGRTAQFASDVRNREQHPRNILEWMRGIIHGEAKLKK